MLWPYLTDNDDLTTIRLPDNIIYFYFCKAFNNETRQDRRPACTELALQVSMMLTTLYQATHLYGFISTSARPLICWASVGPVCIGLTFQVTMTSTLPVHVTNIFTFMSTRLGSMVDQLTWRCLFDEGDVNSSWSHDKPLWLQCAVGDGDVATTKLCCTWLNLQFY